MKRLAVVQMHSVESASFLVVESCVQIETAGAAVDGNEAAVVVDVAAVDTVAVADYQQMDSCEAMT